MIDNEDWNNLEIAARSAVVAGGVSAMGYYREALAANIVLEKNLSPSTLADTKATLDVLQSLSSTIPPIAGKLNFGISFYAEELEQKLPLANEDDREKRIKCILDQAGMISPYIKRTTADFRHSFDNCIAVLFDALDGTTNFRAGIPFFCSAVAFFIKGKPCIGAIYDPLHNVVYYGSLRYNHAGELHSRTAYAWRVQSGSLLDLTGLEKKGKTKRLIATHLTRSDKKKRKEFLEKLDKLTENCGGTYMFNTGQLALAYIASGHLNVFVNNYTNIWDVAAGEVIVRAMGGKVTNFNGDTIDYGRSTKIEVVASADAGVHQKILEILNPGKFGK
jgi:fructose-1,6-bisphosphatase/inositol monophosphatase family enzyme